MPLQMTLPVLMMEYEFWMDPAKGHVVSIDTDKADSAPMQLNVYHSAACTPRPESYSEDVKTAVAAEQHGRQRESTYAALRAAAESGWDFSARWFRDGASLESIDCEAVVPVDLNAILYRVELGLERLQVQVGAPAVAERLRFAAASRKAVMDKALWSSKAGTYRDMWLTPVPGGVAKLAGATELSALSDFAAPLWAGLHGPEPGAVTSILSSLRGSGLLQPGGALTTNSTTGQQWDAPNAWPPLQLMLVEGLRRVGNQEARAMASDLASAWLKSGLEAWQKSGYMYEKYDATRPGVGGGGGEYTPQVGFGWSNGVVLSLLTSPEAAEVV